jgi:hypothetical protein
MQPHQLQRCPQHSGPGLISTLHEHILVDDIVKSIIAVACIARKSLKICGRCRLAAYFQNPWYIRAHRFMKKLFLLLLALAGLSLLFEPTARAGVSFAFGFPIPFPVFYGPGYYNPYYYGPPPYYGYYPGYAYYGGYGPYWRGRYYAYYGRRYYGRGYYGHWHH